MFAKNLQCLTLKEKYLLFFGNDTIYLGRFTFLVGTNGLGATVSQTVKGSQKASRDRLLVLVLSLDLRTIRKSQNIALSTLSKDIKL